MDMFQLDFYLLKLRIYLLPMGMKVDNLKMNNSIDRLNKMCDNTFQAYV